MLHQRHYALRASGGNDSPLQQFKVTLLSQADPPTSSCLSLTKHWEWSTKPTSQLNCDGVRVGMGYHTHTWVCSSERHFGAGITPAKAAEPDEGGHGAGSPSQWQCSGHRVAQHPWGLLIYKSEKIHPAMVGHPSGHIILPLHPTQACVSLPHTLCTVPRKEAPATVSYSALYKGTC